MIETLVTILHVLTCLALILVILLQSGKGGGVSAAFGGGASAALGQRSAGTVLSKFTAIAAAVFMVTSMVLAVFSTTGLDRTLKDVPGVAVPVKKDAKKSTSTAPASAPAKAAAPAKTSAPAKATGSEPVKGAPGNK